MSLGTQIKKARTDLGLTQEALAEALGVGRGFLLLGEWSAEDAAAAAEALGQGKSPAITG